MIIHLWLGVSRVRKFRHSRECIDKSLDISSLSSESVRWVRPRFIVRSIPFAACACSEERDCHVAVACVRSWVSYCLGKHMFRVVTEGVLVMVWFTCWCRLLSGWDSIDGVVLGFLVQVTLLDFVSTSRRVFCFSLQLFLSDPAAYVVKLTVVGV